MVRRIMVASTLTLVASGAAATLPAAAGAATQHRISGSFLEEGPDDFVAVNPTPGFVYVGIDVHPIAFWGGLTGTATSTEHTAERSNGTFETHNIESFANVTVTADDGTVIGSGSLVINFNATGFFAFDNMGNVTDAGFTGAWQIVSAGGGLAGLQGSGTVTGIPGSIGGNGTYTGAVH
jgi:hypothetical protein